MARGQGATVTHIARDPFDFPPQTKSVTYQGVTYTFRELTVGETDEAREGSTIDGNWDGRLMTRLMICASATEPAMTLDQLAKLPQSLYGAVVEVVNDLNDPEALLPKDDPGKS